jgi:hypothetical protein
VGGFGVEHGLRGMRVVLELRGELLDTSGLQSPAALDSPELIRAIEMVKTDPFI